MKFEEAILNDLDTVYKELFRIIGELAYNVTSDDAHDYITRLEQCAMLVHNIRANLTP